MIKIINSKHSEGTLYEVSVECSIKEITENKEEILKRIKGTLDYIESTLVKRD
jgi:hypothetical protein